MKNHEKPESESETVQKSQKTRIDHNTAKVPKGAQKTESESRKKVHAIQKNPTDVNKAWYTEELAVHYRDPV